MLGCSSHVLITSVHNVQPAFCCQQGWHSAGYSRQPYVCSAVDSRQQGEASRHGNLRVEPAAGDRVVSGGLCCCCQQSHIQRKFNSPILLSIPHSSFSTQHAHDMFGDKSTCLLFPQATCLMLLLLLTGSKLRSDAPEFRPTEIPRAAARTEPSHRGGDTPREGAASEDASRRTVQQSSAARTPNGSDKAAQDADATPR